MAKRSKKCYSGIGGQAVLEGIMMKNKTRYSVAVRKPDGQIDVEIGEYKGAFGDSKILKLPFIRGVFNFVDSLVLGTRTLNHSASFFEEEAEPGKAEKAMNRIFKDKAENVLVGFTTILSIAIAIAVFMILPYFLTNLLDTYIRNASLLAILEGVIRILIFVLYVLLISLMKDIRRVYMYHGAEHKCINCIEKGRPLTVENVMRSSKQHKRCGTSFMLFVMVVSVVLFFFIRVDNMALKVLYRILLIPVIAGIAYEIIRLAGKSENWIVRVISAPGMWLQRLTTREPDPDMVEVAIKAVEAVFDWKEYQRVTFGKTFEEDEAKVESEESYEETYEETYDETDETFEETESELELTGDEEYYEESEDADAVYAEEELTFEEDSAEEVSVEEDAVEDAENSSADEASAKVDEGSVLFDDDDDVPTFIRKKDEL